MAHRRSELRRRHHRDDRGHPAQHRGPAERGHSLDSQGQALQSVPGHRGRRRVRRVLSPGRARASSVPFILVVEGSIPDETNKAEGYWATFGTDPATGQPITTCEWIDRLAPRAWAVVAAGTCAAYGGIHAMEGNPTGCHGAARLPRLELAIDARASRIVCLPGCPVQPDNMTETLLYLLHQVVGRAPPIPLDDALAPALAVRADRPRGLRPRRLLRAGRVRRGLRLAPVHREAGLLGTGGAVQRRQARLDGRDRRLPQRRRHLHRVHHARIPRQVQPFMDQPPGSLLSSAAVMTYGRAIQALRRFTQASLNKEPSWRGAAGGDARMRPHDGPRCEAEVDPARPGRRASRVTARLRARRAVSGRPAACPTSEAKYRTLVEQLPAVVFMAYLDRGHRRGVRQPPDRGDARVLPGGVAGGSGPLVPPDPPGRPASAGASRRPRCS